MPTPHFPPYDKLPASPWRNRPVQGKPFWFTLGGADDSPAHMATLKQRPLADAGLASYGVAEWGYSFHHLKNGALDGAGYKHYGGYPQPPRTRAEAAAVRGERELALTLDDELFLQKMLLKVSELS